MKNNVQLTGFAKRRATDELLTVEATRLFSQHLLIIGQTGSGKSTSAVALLNALMKKDQTAIILDPTGEYAHLPHAVVGKLGGNAFIDFAKLSAAQLAAVIGIHDVGMLTLLTDAITSLRIAQNVCHQAGPYVKVGLSWELHEHNLTVLHDYPRPYNIRLLPEQLLEECVQPAEEADADFSVIGQQYDYPRQRQLVPVLSAIRKFLADPTMQHLFRLPPAEKQRQTVTTTQYDVVYLLKMFSAMKASQRFLVIDISSLTTNLAVGKLVVSTLAAALLSNKVALAHTVPVVLVVDEAHRYLTAAANQVGWVDNDGLSRVAREGRKAGLYLMLTTQSPLDIPRQLLGEFGNLLVHRVTTADELAQLPIINQVGTDITRQQVGQATLMGTGFDSEIAVTMLKTDEVRHDTDSPKFEK